MNECTDDGCDPGTGCTHEPIECAEIPCKDLLGCDPALGCRYRCQDGLTAQVLGPVSVCIGGAVEWTLRLTNDTMCAHAATYTFSPLANSWLVVGGSGGQTVPGKANPEDPPVVVDVPIGVSIPEACAPPGGTGIAWEVIEGGGEDCPPVTIASGTKPVIRKRCIDLQVGLIPDADECDPGACIVLNDDDDDVNAVVDMQQSGPIAGEDDLLSVVVSAPGLALSGSESVVFDVHTGFESRVRVYESPDRTGQVPSVPLIVPATDLPKVFYVEGIGPSLSPRDVVLEGSYSGSLGTAADKAHLSVIGVGMAYVPTGFAVVEVQYKKVFQKPSGSRCNVVWNGSRTPVT